MEKKESITKLNPAGNENDKNQSISKGNLATKSPAKEPPPLLPILKEKSDIEKSAQSPPPLPVLKEIQKLAPPPPQPSIPKEKIETKNSVVPQQPSVPNETSNIKKLFPPPLITKETSDSQKLVQPQPPPPPVPEEKADIEKSVQPRQQPLVPREKSKVQKLISSQRPPISKEKSVIQKLFPQPSIRKEKSEIKKSVQPSQASVVPKETPEIQKSFPPVIGGLDAKTEAVFNRMQYVFECKLPKNPGSFGTTYRGKRVTMPVAIKVLDLARLSPKFFDDKFIPRHLCTLVDFRRNCPDRNVARLYDVVRSQDRLYMFMELYQNNLAGYLEEEKSKGRPSQPPIDDPMAQRWAKQILQALQFLHQQLKAAHRHIKLENILLDQKGDARLSDFGLAKEFWNPFTQVVEKTTVICATEPYQCPQHLRFQPHDAYQADMWAFGVVLFFLLLQRFPFDRTSPRRQILIQQTDGYPAFLESSLPAGCNKAAAGNLVIRLLNPDETKRPGPALALEHEWIVQ